MNAPALRLGTWHQVYLYSVGAVLVLSGVLWLGFHYYVRVEGDFGPTLHPLEPWWLRVHGVSAAAFLIGFGSVLPGHVRRAWSAARNRVTGTVFFAVMLALTLTGYLLYYVGDEATRDMMSLIHWAIGLAFPALTLLHVWRGRVWRRLKIAEARAGANGGVPGDGGQRAAAARTLPRTSGQEN